MSKANIGEKELIDLLKKGELKKPTKEFSKRLTSVIIQEYEQKQGIEYKVENWLGKFILLVLVFFSLLFFYYLNPFSILPEFFISVSAFVMGLWGLIGLLKKAKFQFLS
tara:strand:+ start:176 stop:502 length:327 start_codon:yes stop_codon:yes gene_type:complete